MQEHTINGEIVTIHVTRRNGDKHDVLVDLDDWQWLKDYSVCITYNERKILYAMTTDAENKKWFLHRAILQPSEHLQVDHIHGNTLDCRKSELRVGTQSENQQNRQGSTKVSSSGIRGVSWYPKYNKWMAKATIAGQQKTLGYFDNIGEAAECVQNYREQFMPFSNN